MSPCIVTFVINVDERTGVDGMVMRGGVNFDVALSLKVVVSYANGCIEISRS